MTHKKLLKHLEKDLDWAKKTNPALYERTETELMILDERLHGRNGNQRERNYALTDLLE